MRFEDEQDAEKATLPEAKAWLRDRMNVGAHCPCCAQFAKVYKRKLNSSMAYVLVLVDKRTSGPHFLHMPSFINADVQNPTVAAAVRGDWAKLTHWGLLEEQPNQGRDDGSMRAGFYRITDKGRAFVHGRLRLPRHIWIYAGNPLPRVDSETISITEALGSRFRYSELLEAR